MTPQEQGRTPQVDPIIMGFLRELDTQVIAKTPLTRNELAAVNTTLSQLLQKLEADNLELQKLRQFYAAAQEKENSKQATAMVDDAIAHTMPNRPKKTTD